MVAQARASNKRRDGTYVSNCGSVTISACGGEKMPKWDKEYGLFYIEVLFFISEKMVLRELF